MVGIKDVIQKEIIVVNKENIVPLINSAFWTWKDKW